MRRRGRASRPVALLLALALGLGGCWDRSEIEDTAYLSSIGVDVADGEYLWTFRVIEAERLPVGTLTALPPPAGRLPGLVTARAASLEQALQLVQANLVRVLTLEQVRFITFGEEVARQGLGPLISQFLRHNQMRRTMGVHVAAGRAVDIFANNRPVGEVNPVKFLEGALTVERRWHLAPPVRFQHVYARLLAPGADPLLSLIAVNPMAGQAPGSPLPPMAGRSLRAGEFPRTGGNPVEAAGSAVFRGDRMVGTLTVDETAALLALRGEMGKVYMTLPDPQEEGQMLTLRVHQENKPQYRARFSGDRPVVHVRLQFEGELLSSPGRTDYSQPAQRRALERAVVRHFQRELYGPLLRRVYNEWGADPVGLGNLFRTRFPTFTAWLEYRWPDHVREIQITVEIELFIRRFGLLLDNPQPE